MTPLLWTDVPSFSCGLAVPFSWEWPSVAGACSAPCCSVVSAAVGGALGCCG